MEEKHFIRDMISSVYGYTNINIISLTSVSKIKSKSYGSIKMIYHYVHKSDKENTAFIHFAKLKIKLMKEDDLRDFCIPFQLWARNNGFQAPSIWRTLKNDFIWKRYDYHGYIEDKQHGKIIAKLSPLQLYQLGKWMGLIHRRAINFRPVIKRKIHLNLKNVHLRWSNVLFPMLNQLKLSKDSKRRRLFEWLNHNKKNIHEIIIELKERVAAGNQGEILSIHGDSNADNILWDNSDKQIIGILDWKGSRYDFQIADLIVPLRKLVIGEGQAEKHLSKEHLQPFSSGFFETNGSLTQKQRFLLVPALLALDVSFFTWQMKQPLYIERAMARTRDFMTIIDRRKIIEESF